MAKLTKDEYAHLTSSEVKNAEDGHNYLSRTHLIAIGKPTTMLQLSLALFHITQISSAVKTVIEPIQAVAFLLEEAAAAQIAESVAHKVIIALSPQIGNLHVTAETMKTLTTSLPTQDLPTMEALTHLTTAVNNTHCSLENLKEQIEANPIPPRRHQSDPQPPMPPPPPQ